VAQLLAQKDEKFEFEKQERQRLEQRMKDCERQMVAGG